MSFACRLPCIPLPPNALKVPDWPGACDASSFAAPVAPLTAVGGRPACMTFAGATGRRLHSERNRSQRRGVRVTFTEDAYPRESGCRAVRREQRGLRSVRPGPRYEPPRRFAAERSDGNGRLCTFIDESGCHVGPLASS